MFRLHFVDQSRRSVFDLPAALLDYQIPAFDRETLDLEASLDEFSGQVEARPMR